MPCCQLRRALPARMGAADLGNTVLGRPVGVVAADHMNKPDTGLAIAREWFGPGGVQMVASVGNPDLIGKACSPNSSLWALDNWSSTVAPVRAQLKAGKTRFYFIAVDYACGKTLEADATAAITAGGGTVVGVSMALISLSATPSRWAMASDLNVRAACGHRAARRAA